MSGDLDGVRCEREQLAVGWALHVLEPDEEAVFLAHLPDCDRCQRTVRETRELVGTLNPAEPGIEVPTRLRERMRTAIAAAPPPRTTPAHAPKPPTPAQRRWRPALTGVAMLLLTAAVVILGIRVSHLATERDAEVAKAQTLSQALEALTDPAATMIELHDAGGHEIAVLVVGHHAATIVPSGLVANDEGHVYVVWGTSGFRPAPLATFDVGAPPGATALTWSTQSSWHRGFAISLEPGRTAPPVPSTVVATGQVPAS